MQPCVNPQGGHYSADNVATYRASLGAIDDHMTAAQAAQAQRLVELQADLLKQVGLVSAMAIAAHCLLRKHTTFHPACAKLKSPASTALLPIVWSQPSTKPGEHLPYALTSTRLHAHPSARPLCRIVSPPLRTAPACRRLTTRWRMCWSCCPATTRTWRSSSSATRCWRRRARRHAPSWGATQRCAGRPGRWLRRGGGPAGDLHSH